MLFCIYTEEEWYIEFYIESILEPFNFSRIMCTDISVCLVICCVYKRYTACCPLHRPWTTRLKFDDNLTTCPSVRKLTQTVWLNRFPKSMWDPVAYHFVEIGSRPLIAMDVIDTTFVVDSNFKNSSPQIIYTDYVQRQWIKCYFQPLYNYKDILWIWFFIISTKWGLWFIIVQNVWVW